MSAFLGIDGGGTKTAFLLMDADGAVLARGQKGTAYYPQIGVDALRAMLHEGISETLAAAGLEPSALAFTCIGLPSYGEDSTLTATLDAIAAPLLPVARVRCVNDMVCGWAGALAGGDGISIVAGTGSIGYGEFKGRSARAGGWGDLFGDEGSAFWIAREALNLFSRMSDGREAPGPLLDVVRTHFGLRMDLDLCARLYGPPTLARSEVAALAPLAADAARQGDFAARHLFANAGAELARIAHAIRDGLGVPEPVALPVSYSGGLFNLRDVLVPGFEAALHSGARRYEFCMPRCPPDVGAALYAARVAGTPLAGPALKRLMPQGVTSDG